MVCPESGVKEFVVDLARRHHIVFEKTYGDAWAETITRLSDDDVVMDDVDRLLIALKRAGVISGREMVTLLVNYMRDNQ